MTDHALPTDVEYVRTTARFTESSVPAGLLAAHRVAANTWGVLTVHTGELGFVFEDDPTERRLGPGETQVIPPLLAHHLVIDGAVSFDVAFHRRSSRGVPGRST